MQEEERSGFVAVVGKPNAGKSSLLNWLVDEKIAMVSKKANATRKRAKIIVMHKNTQFIFIDTPGIHEKERLLNKFMLEESIKAMGDCDLILFLSPVTDSLQSYKDFLSLEKNTKHIVLLTKCDKATNKQVLSKLDEFNAYGDKFTTIIPISTRQESSKEYLLEALSPYIPIHPFLYDPELLTTQMIREIYQELIREAIFEYTSDEIPYSTEVRIDKVEENPHLHNVYATIIVEKESQKGIVIGKGGETLKRIGRHSRLMIEKLADKKVFLKLLVIVNQNWTKNDRSLKKMGFH